MLFFRLNALAVGKRENGYAHNVLIKYLSKQDSHVQVVEQIMTTAPIASAVKKISTWTASGWLVIITIPCSLSFSKPLNIASLILLRPLSVSTYSFLSTA